jgi:AAA domain/PLD-like domain
MEDIARGRAVAFESVNADRVLTNSQPGAPLLSIEYAEELSEAQRRFIGLALAAPLAWLWGPPGTGKTWTLTALVEALAERGDRILVLSNTNKAVDQVLLGLCRRLGREHRTVQAGEIVRVGRIIHPELDRDWADAVMPEKIAERLSVELRSRIESLVRDQAEAKKEHRRLSHLLEPLRGREGARKSAMRAAERASDALIEHEHAAHAVNRARANLARFQDELVTFSEASKLRRLMMRKNEAIESDIEKAETQLSRAIASEHEKRGKYEAEKVAAEAARSEADLLDQQTAGLELSGVETKIGRIEQQLTEFAARLAVLHRQIEEIASQIVAKAKIVGATVTKTFLSPSMFIGFQSVILDEASMILVPACYHAAGLARSLVVVSGDFRQLPPILPTDTTEIIKAIGGDVFDRAGITHAVDAEADVPNLVMLTDQWRYTPSVCDLVSRSMYGGRLRTALKRERRVPRCSTPFHGPITILDTSDIGALAIRHLARGSRLNVSHALVIRNLVRNLIDNRAIVEPRQIGVMSPYAAQAELHANACRNLDVEIDCGTVHRFQGDERDIIVLDLTEAPGECDYLGRPLRGERPTHPGARLINVALTRPTTHLIIVMHVAHFRRHAGPDTMIGRHLEMLYRTNVPVVPAPDVLSLYPPESQRCHIETPPEGIFDQATFFAALNADIQQASTSIDVFSGFMTIQRVAHLESSFRDAITRGVRIRCVTRPPGRDMPPSAKTEKALEALESWGVTVDLRHAIHQKAVLIDNQIAYFGSLNPLSATAHTLETMLRFDTPEAVSQLQEALVIPGMRIDREKMGGIRENPPCPECRRRTIFHAAGFSLRNAGRAYDAFWRCEACSWKANHRAYQRQ